MKRSPYAFRVTIVLVTLLSAANWGFVASGGILHVPETAEVKAVRVTIHPAAEARPALKYELLPPFLERTPGNAAVHYGKVTAEQAAFFADTELQEKLWKWNQTPLDELPRDEIRRIVESPLTYGALRRAARCEYCDWQLPIREGEFFAMLLPEVHQMRSFARIVALRARLQIAEGKFEEAIETLQTGYVMGRNAAEGETLISGFVGVAICSIMSGQLEELIQEPGAPNLYWALTMLPRPLVDMQPGIEAERDAIYLMLPELRDLDDTSRSAEQWRELLERFWEKVAGYADLSETAARPEALTVLGIAGYPMAKRALIERGRSPEVVEAMSVPQVILIYTLQTYDELRDDLFRWFYVPYSDTREGSRKAEENFRRAVTGRREILPVAAVLLPAVRAAHAAIARNDREIAGLRTIEALRMYAATNEGRLPEKLNDLPVPVPLDPFTGRPFDYKLDGETAVLEGPPAPGLLFRVEVKVAH
ncbi:MAG: hypothetical protein HQ582_18300 [Planctomycetes bacterium]|nr:hypothetical protein [Planctomycetota bacterium]